MKVMLSWNIQVNVLKKTKNWQERCMMETAQDWSFVFLLIGI
jgi:hypothetical protein